MPAGCCRHCCPHVCQAGAAVGTLCPHCPGAACSPVCLNSLSSSLDSSSLGLRVKSSLYLLVTWQHQPVRRLFWSARGSSPPQAPLDGLKLVHWTPLVVVPIFPALLGCFNFTGRTQPPAIPGQLVCGSLGTLHFSPFPSFPVSRLINLMSYLSSKNTNDLPLASS